MEFSGNIVFVGASSGIGACTAIEFAKQRAKMVLTGRNEENLRKTFNSCLQAGTPEDHVSNISERILSKYPRHCWYIVVFWSFSNVVVIILITHFVFINKSPYIHSLFHGEEVGGPLAPR